MEILTKATAQTLVVLLALASGWAQARTASAKEKVVETSRIRISIGALTKYTGSPANQNEGQDFLATLETLMAASFVNAKDIDYLDRSNLDALLTELHLSSSSVFDRSTGALRGLLGRLDLLIVIEASTAARARIRVLDVERGVVKAVEICETSDRPLTSTPVCVQQLVNQSLATAREILTLKQNRIAKAEAAQRGEQAGELRKRTKGYRRATRSQPQTG